MALAVQHSNSTRNPPQSGGNSSRVSEVSLTTLLPTVSVGDQDAPLTGFLTSTGAAFFRTAVVRTHILNEWLHSLQSHAFRIDLTTYQLFLVAKWSGLQSPEKTESIPTITPITVGYDEELNLALSQLVDVFRNPDEEEVKPTSYAFVTAYNLLLSAKRQPPTLKTFPSASVAADDNGNIFVFWRDRRRKLHLFVPISSEKRTYIYHEDGDSYAVEYDITGQTLANWLDWYASA
jgi:hypothetical protein